MATAEGRSFRSSLLDGGECARLIAGKDWSATVLGPIDSWPGSLRTAVSILLRSPVPMVMLWGSDGIMLYNDAYAVFAGGRHPELLGSKVREGWPEVAEFNDNVMKVGLAGGTLAYRDQELTLYRHGEPEQVFMDLDYSPVLDERGEPAGVLAIVVETSRRVAIERQLRESEARYRQIVEGAEEFAIVTLDAHGIITGWNTGAERITGYPEAEAIGAPGDIFFTAEDREAGIPVREMNRAHADGRAVNERWHERKDGSRFWGSGLLMRVDEERGGYLKIFRDRTAEHEVEAALRQSEAEFRLMADAVPQIVWITDAEGRTEFFNKQWSDYTGAAYQPSTAAEIAASHVHPDDQAATMEAFEAARSTGSPFVVEHRIRARDGSYRWFLVRAEPHVDAHSGKVARWFGASVDIHDRRQAEAALRESEARLAFLDRLGAETAALADADAVLATTTRLVGEHLDLSVCAYADMDEDQDGFTIRGDWAAPGAQSIVGHYSLADFGRLAVQNLTAGLPLVVNDNLRELAPEEAATFQNIGIAATICMPLVKEGRLTALMAIHDRVPRTWTAEELALLREVTARSWAHVERVAAVEDLRESEARYRTLFERIESGFCVAEVDANAHQGRGDYRVVEANPAFFRQTGFQQAIMGQWLRDAAPALEEHWFETYGRVASSGVPERFEQGSDMLGRWFDVYAFRIGRAEERRVAILFNDISARRNAEQVLRGLNDTLEQQVAVRTAERDRVWANSRDLLTVIDLDGVFRAVNPAWTLLLGYEADELVGRSYLEFIHVDDHPSSRSALETASRTDLPLYENRYRHKDGSYRWISWLASPEGNLIYAYGRDVTAERQRQAELELAQEALRQSQKMEAMGQLTGGVAHDFNNLLSPIVGSLDMLQRRGVGGEREQRLIAGAMQSADRAKTLVQRLLAFARRQPLQATAVDVGRLVADMAELLDSTTGPQIRLMVEIADDLPAATADPNQLEMALLNLGVNARDAMPDGGTLRISAGVEEIEAGHRSNLRPGRYIRLSVADTGTGMDEATIARAIEPFFSTKGVGKGTGLGLSMVHGLASQLGGALTIQSRPGLGTNVELWLAESLSDPAASAPDASVEPAEVATHGTALLVDDEELVRMSTAEMLGELGYSVVEAASGEEAMRLVNSGRRFDLMVTDHLMPGITGADLARAVRAKQPELPVLLVSGYAEQEGIEPDLPRMTKSFRRDELAATLARLQG